VIALKREIGVRERKLSNHQLDGLGHLCEFARRAHLAEGFLHLRIVGIVGAELKRVGLLHQQNVFEAHRGFARVVNSGRQFGARIIYVRTGHARR
jgi:hypothetical protein